MINILVICVKFGIKGRCFFGGFVKGQPANVMYAPHKKTNAKKYLKDSNELQRDLNSLRQLSNNFGDFIAFSEDYNAAPAFIE